MMRHEDWYSLRVGDLIKNRRSGVTYKITQRHENILSEGATFVGRTTNKPHREYRLLRDDNFEKVDTVVYSTIIDIAEGVAVEDVSAMLGINPTEHALLETLRGKRVLESLRGKRVKITMELVED